MKGTHPTAIGRHLVWLVLQSWVLLPMCLGQLMVEDWADAGWGYRLVDVLLIEVTGFLVIRNLDRLWRAPADEAGVAGVVALVLVGARVHGGVERPVAGE